MAGVFGTSDADEVTVMAPPAMDFPQQRDAAENPLAFVFIAMGPVAASPGIQYAIASLRTVGGYAGRIFVLTDRPTCFSKLEHPALSDRTHVVLVEAPKAQLRDTLHNVAYHRTQFRMLKTQIFFHLPEDVEYAAFLDSDVLTLGQNCVADFTKRNVFTGHAEDWPENMAIRTKWWSGEGPHLGSFVIRRNHSEALLARWADEFSKDDFLDRVSFVKAATALYDLPEATTSDATAVARRSQFIGPIIHGDDFLSAKSVPEPTCFVHISTARCNDLGSRFVDKRLRGVVPGYNYDMCKERRSMIARVESGLERLGVVVLDTCPVAMEADGMRGSQRTALAVQSCGVAFLLVLFLVMALACRRSRCRPFSWRPCGGGSKKTILT